MFCQLPNISIRIIHLETKKMTVNCIHESTTYTLSWTWARTLVQEPEWKTVTVY